MRREIAAKRYAEAVFQIARDSQSLSAWRADLQAIGGVLGEPEILALLESGKVPEPAKFDLLRRSLAGVSPLALNFAMLLVQRRRVALAPQVTDFYFEMADNYLGIAHAEVTTAVPVSAEEQQLIAEQLSRITGKKVDVQMRTDPSIIGGMIAKIGDRLIDGSTRSRLIALRSRLEVAR
jgi:F-type H+-transporting ATPase subunit delta